MVCGCVLHRGQRGEVWCVSSTLCSYDIMMRLLLVLRVGRGCDVLMYEFVMFVLQEVCLYYASVYLC